ncbi:MAG TPA: LysM peptidoglycan-binding domain-containing protein [Candidatus Limnocylindria bacterium]
MDTFTGELPLPPTIVWKVLAAVVWVAWMQVVAAVGVEIRALMRGGLARSIRGLGLGQSLAGPLVAAIVLAWPAGAMARPAPAPAQPLASALIAAPPPRVEAEVATEAAWPEAVPRDEAPPGESTAAFVEHVVERRDTLWGIAERYCGSGTAAPELFALNRGRVQPDGRALAEPSLLRPGWIILVPSDDPPTDAGPAAPGVGQQVVVEPGDTLSGIAEEVLHDANRHREIADLNRDRVQPDGRRLTDADVIQPGWTLDVPAGQPVAQPVPDEPLPDVQVPPPPGPPPTEDPAAPEPDDPDTSPEAPPAPDPSLPPEPAPAPEASRPTVDDPLPAEQSDGRDVDAESGHPVVPVGLIGGGLATAGLLVILDRRRRAQQRHRRAGERLPEPPPAAQAAERELRIGADTESAGYLEAALRASMAGNGPEGPPPLRWVESDGEGVTMILAAESDAPPGFVNVDERRWRTTAPLDELAQLGRSSASPAPALVPVGRAEGHEVLVDLETSVTTVSGEPLAVEGLLRAVAVTAATSPWNDQARVMLVGQDRDALPPIDGLEACDDFDRALDEIRARRDAVAHNLGFLGYDTVTAARASGVSPDAWEPLVVVFAERPHDDEHLARLREVVREPSPGIAVVVHGAPGMEPLGRMMCISDDELTIDGVDMPLRCRDLDDGSLRQVTRLLDHATAPSAPVDDAPRAQRRAPAEPALAEESRGGALDELLRDVEVTVHVLGEVHATTGPEGEPLTTGKQKSLEALTYLALRESPVDKEELQAALWPAGTSSLKTFHNTIWAARKALGTARPDSDLFPEPAEGRYALSEAVATDYGLFCELVALADEEEDARRAAMLLAEALTLVEGEPFTGGGRGYAWVAPHSGLIIAQVVDAAEELAEVRLAGDDWRGAEWAARQGLKVCPYEERLYRLLMRSAFAAGSLPGVRRVYDELTDVLADPDDGVEPEDTVHPDTTALLERLTGPTRARHSA